MITGYIDKLSKYLDKTIKLNIFGLDDLVECVKKKDTEFGSFIDTNYLLNKHIKEISIILDFAGKDSILVLMVDGLLDGLNSILIMGDKKISFTYFYYSIKPIKQEFSIRYENSNI